MDLSYKKRRSIQNISNGKMLSLWQDNQEDLDISKLRFLDESSINTGMTPLYGFDEK